MNWRHDFGFLPFVASAIRWREDQPWNQPPVACNGAGLSVPHTVLGLVDCSRRRLGLGLTVPMTSCAVTQRDCRRNRCHGDGDGVFRFRDNGRLLVRRRLHSTVFANFQDSILTISRPLTLHRAKVHAWTGVYAPVLGHYDHYYYKQVCLWTFSPLFHLPSPPTSPSPTTLPRVQHACSI